MPYFVTVIDESAIRGYSNIAMEFPELGVHCAEPSCSRLDFLPFTCDACHRVFCLDHKTYEEHRCTESYSKDARVPVCPLCNQPVPVNRGDDPNIKVDQHIHNDCKSEAAKKLYTNKCSYKGCKKKELVQVRCNTCKKTFCLKHRFETDHACEGDPNRLGSGSKCTGTTPQATTLSAIGAQLNRARLERQKHQAASHQQPPSSANMKEDQALAAAIAASLNEPVATSSQQPHMSQQDEDEALARAIAESLQESQKKKKEESDTCIVC